VERDHRDHRHRPPVVSGRRHPAHDTLIVDEIHQTSAELELCLALGKRVGCRFIWLSATVDPTFYARYLDSADVVQSFAFDPSRAASVKVVREQPVQFLSDRFLQQVVRQRRGVGMFLPTRASVEEAARYVEARSPRINAAFYHGGERYGSSGRFSKTAPRSRSSSR
jgi:hypothetical protein